MTNTAKLRPARRDDLIASIAFILSKKSTRRSSLGTTERIVAEKLIDELETANYVICNGPPAEGGAALASGAKDD
jgi:hypothetical protein